MRFSNRSRVLLAVLLVSAPAVVRAQSDSTGSSSTCLRFMFGPWTPALDWQAAGHGVSMDSAHTARDAAGRGWAAPTAAAGDSVLLLFPPWWPAGVSIGVASRALASGDTVIGRATALVADARRVAPVSRARVWRVSCGG